MAWELKLALQSKKKREESEVSRSTRLLVSWTDVVAIVKGAIDCEYGVLLHLPSHLKARQ